MNASCLFFFLVEEKREREDAADCGIIDLIDDDRSIIIGCRLCTH